jgi:hypothetical protein
MHSKLYISKTKKRAVTIGWNYISEDWVSEWFFVNPIREGKIFGHFKTKAQAKNRALNWMRAHPRG